MGRSRLRFGLVVGLAGTIAAGLWWNGGVSRATAILEIPGGPEEAAAVRGMLPLVLADPEVWKLARTDLPLGLDLDALRDGSEVVGSPLTAATVELRMTLPRPDGLSAALRALVPRLATRIGHALPGMRESRLAAIEARLKALDAVRGAAAVEAAPGVLEVERDELLREHSRWLVQDRAPGAALRLVTELVRLDRVRPDPWPFAALVCAVAAFAAVLEGLGGTATRHQGPAAATGEGSGASGPGPASGPSPTVRIPSGPPRSTHRTPAPRPEAAPPPPALPPPPAPPPVPELARLPRFPGLSPTDPRTLRVPQTPAGSMPEPFPALAARLAVRAKPLRSLMVTALAPGAGSTLVAASLARTVARSGRRVVLFDANLRRPALHRVFGLEVDEGLTDLLLDRGLAGIPVPVGEGKLEVVAAGDLPPTPEDLLASPRLEVVLAELRRSEDLAVLDVPPAFEGGDALLVAAVVDAVLLVVPARTPPAEAAAKLAELLALGVPLVGTVQGWGS